MGNVKRADVILLVCIAMIGMLFFGIRGVLGSSDGSYVEVTITGKPTEKYSLDQDQEISLGSGGNTLKIVNGVADMIWADCPDQLCVQQKAISKNNETIICLPNEVVVTVIAEDDQGIDGISK